jgi:hypothetical protein
MKKFRLHAGGSAAAGFVSLAGYPYPPHVFPNSLQGSPFRCISIQFISSLHVTQRQEGSEATKWKCWKTLELKKKKCPLGERRALDRLQCVFVVDSSSCTLVFKNTSNSLWYIGRLTLKKRLCIMLYVRRLRGLTGHCFSVLISLRWRLWSGAYAELAHHRKLWFLLDHPAPTRFTSRNYHIQQSNTFFLKDCGSFSMSFFLEFLYVI